MVIDELEETPVPGEEGEAAVEASTSEDTATVDDAWEDDEAEAGSPADGN